MIRDPIEFAGESEGECNCCGRYRYLSRVWAFGNMETWACDECLGPDDEDLRYETERNLA